MDLIEAKRPSLELPEVLEASGRHWRAAVELIRAMGDRLLQASMISLDVVPRQVVLHVSEICWHVAFSGRKTSF